MKRKQFLTLLQYIRNDVSESDYHSPPQIITGRCGRPSYNITREQLKFLVDSAFTVPQMSDIIGVSTRTIERRLSEYGMAYP